MGPVFQMLVLTAAALLGDCDGCDCAAADLLGGDGGRVYECTAPGYATVELCADMPADELAAQVFPQIARASCTPTSRWWPRIAGCLMVCPPDTGRGCNAFNGCFCPGG